MTMEQNASKSNVIPPCLGCVKVGCLDWIGRWKECVRMVRESAFRIDFSNSHQLMYINSSSLSFKELCHSSMANTTVTRNDYNCSNFIN